MRIALANLVVKDEDLVLGRNVEGTPHDVTRMEGTAKSRIRQLVETPETMEAMFARTVNV